MKEFPVYFITSTKLADYYAVGAAKQVTVSVRAKSGLLLCHTCRANKCEHTPSVEQHLGEHVTPEQQQWQRDRAERLGAAAVPVEPRTLLDVSLEWVEL